MYVYVHHHHLETMKNLKEIREELRSIKKNVT